MKAILNDVKCVIQVYTIQMLCRYVCVVDFFSSIVQPPHSYSFIYVPLTLFTLYKFIE